MKRASYREAVEWIAWNDDGADGPNVEVIDAYVSTALVADLFGVETMKVARDIARHREKNGIADRNRVAP